MVWIKDPHQTKPHGFTTPNTLTAGEFMTIINHTGGIYLKWNWLEVKLGFANNLFCGHCDFQHERLEMSHGADRWDRVGLGLMTALLKRYFDLLKEITKLYVGCAHCLHCHRLWFTGRPDRREILHWDRATASSQGRERGRENRKDERQKIRVKRRRLVKSG